MGWNSHQQLFERAGGERAQLSTGVGRVEGIVDKEMMFAKIWRQSVNQFS